LTEPLYAAEILVSDSLGDIADVNSATGAVTNFESLTNANNRLFDVAYTSSGTLYGTTELSLYSISGGAATPIGGAYSGGLHMSALTGFGTGLLGAANNSTSIYTINTSSGVATVNGTYSSGGYTSAGDLAFAGSTLYDDVVGSNGYDELVNASSGTVVGYFCLGAACDFSDFYGLAYDPTTDTMYGVAGTQVYTVDLSTGGLTADGNWSSNSLGLQSATGATIAPTPLPAALPLFATGLVGLGLFGWRRKRKAAASIAAA